MLKQLLAGGSVVALLLTTAMSAQASNHGAAAQAQAPTAPMQAAPQPVEINPEVIQQFVSAVTQLQSIQAEAQTEMVQAIEAEGLKPERFNEILQAQQLPAAESMEVSAEEAEQFQQAVSQVQTIQSNAQTRMQQAVEAEGLEVEQFNQILAQVQQDPELLQQVQQQLQD